jgi:uncharacterized OB-fold protein
MTESGLPSAPHSITDYRKAYEEEGALRGFRSGCGYVSVTWALACPQCGQRDLTEVALAREGELRAVTVQHVPSDEFLNEAPYAYVLVALDGGGTVAGWVEGVRTDAELQIGDRVRFRPSYKPGVQFERIGTSPKGGQAT